MFLPIFQVWSFLWIWTSFESFILLFMYQRCRQEVFNTTKYHGITFMNILEFVTCKILSLKLYKKLQCPLKARLFEPSFFAYHFLSFIPVIRNWNHPLYNGAKLQRTLKSFYCHWFFFSISCLCSTVNPSALANGIATTRWKPINLILL